MQEAPVTSVPEGAVQAAVKAVNAKEWKADAPWSIHNIHDFDSDCAVCKEDVPAIVAVALEAAAPVLTAQLRREVAEQIAAALLAVDPVEWALAGQHAGEDAARIARQIGESR